MANNIQQTMSRQYLTFCLEKEYFALEIGKVREVLDYLNITKVPRTPDFMSGVINLRGSVVPVIDLRLILGMEAIEKTVNTCIVITEAKIDDEIVIFGALADSVQEVLDIDADKISPPPKLGAKINADFICGMSKHNDDFLIILDIDKVLSSDELSTVRNVHEENVSQADSELMEQTG